MDDLDWTARVGAVPWTESQTAYGVAGDVPGQLVALRSDLPAALMAAHDLWCGLCHQHAFISSAALSALPFLLEVVEDAPDVLIVELLDIFVGFARLTAPGVATNMPDWANELRAGLVAARPRFETLANHPNSDVRQFAAEVIDDLDAR